MSIIESTATALVRFTGLGIICFNQAQQRGEIALIRDEKHALSVKIQQPRFKDGIDKDIIVYEDMASYTDLQKKSVEIEIMTKGKSAINGYEIYQAKDEFDRLISDDTNDFRWIVNMANLHGEKLTASKSENRYPISKLFIENGLFYVHKLDTDLFFEKVEKDADGNEKNREILGNVAETIGVKIESDEVVFKIKIGDREESHTLSRVNGLPFRIEVKNMDYSDEAVYSDMKDYQKYFSTPNGTTYELEPIKTDQNTNVATGESVGRDFFCHPLDGGDIASIEELEG